MSSHWRGVKCERRKGEGKGGGSGQPSLQGPEVWELEVREVVETKELTGNYCRERAISKTSEESFLSHPVLRGRRTGQF